jgi:pseudouridine kinase
MPEGRVLVIGSAGIDVKAIAPEPVLWDTTNLGRVRTSVGGVARNIAENLAQLEVETQLLTAVGRDSFGRQVLRHSRDHGVDCGHVRALRDAHTSSRVSIMK